MTPWSITCMGLSHDKCSGFMESAPVPTTCNCNCHISENVDELAREIAQEQREARCE